MDQENLAPLTNRKTTSPSRRDSIAKVRRELQSYRDKSDKLRAESPSIALWDGFTEEEKVKQNGGLPAFMADIHDRMRDAKESSQIQWTKLILELAKGKDESLAKSYELQDIDDEDLNNAMIGALIERIQSDAEFAYGLTELACKVIARQPDGPERLQQLMYVVDSARRDEEEEP